jgi:GTP cyclohydrolase II
MVEQKNQIIDLLSSHIEKIDWLQETPIEVKDILPIVKSHEEEKELVGWED